MNPNQSEKQTKRYYKKYKYLKLRIRSLLIENAALCDEVAKIQESIFIVKDERKFLLRKLLEYENDMDVNPIYSRHEPSMLMNGTSRGKIKKRHSFEDTGKSVIS